MCTGRTKVRRKEHFKDAPHAWIDHCACAFPPRTEHDRAQDGRAPWAPNSEGSPHQEAPRQPSHNTHYVHPLHSNHYTHPSGFLGPCILIPPKGSSSCQAANQTRLQRRAARYFGLGQSVRVIFNAMCTRNAACAVHPVLSSPLLDSPCVSRNYCLSPSLPALLEHHPRGR